MIRVLVVLAAALGFAALAPVAASAQAVPCTKTWSGPATGVWSSAGSWTPAGVPTATDVVCLGADTDTRVDTNLTVRAVRDAGTLRFSSNRLTLSDVTVPSTIDTSRIPFGPGSSPGIDGPADVTFRQLLWGDGTIGGTGTTTVTERHEFGGRIYLGAGRTLVTAGTGSWTNTSVSLYAGAAWTNRAAVDVVGSSIQDDSTAGQVRPVLRNEAAGSLTRTEGDSSIGVLLDNDGTIASTGPTGILRVGEGTGDSSGRYVGVNGRPGGLILGGFRTPLPLGDGVVIEHARIDADLLMPPGGRLELASVQIFQGRVTGRGTLVLSGDSHLIAARLGPREMVVVLPADATLLWSAANSIGARRIETAGRVTVTETGLGRPQTTFGERTVWENTGTIELQAGQFPVFAGDEAARIVNRGTIIKTGQEGNPASQFEVRPRIVNDGVVEIRSGTLLARRFEQGPGGTLRFDIRGTAVRTDYGQLNTTALRYSGRLEATFSTGFAPAPASRFAVMPGLDRSGIFGSTALGGLTLDESPRTSIDLVAPAALAARGAGPGASAVPDAFIAPVVAPLRAVLLRAQDDRLRLRPGRTRTVDLLANDQAPAGTQVRLVGSSSALRVRLDGRSGRLRVRNARRTTGRRVVRLRYRLVGPDGRRSPAARVHVHIA